MKKNKYIGYLLILPTYILFALFFLIPLLYSFKLTFYEWNGFSPTMEFVGLQNYMMLFQSQDFINALKNTVVYAGSTVILAVFISLVLSVVVQDGIKGYQTIKGIYFLPHIVSLVAVGVVWSWVFLPNSSGLLNAIIGVFGLESQKWLADPNLAMGSLVIIGVWKSIGYNMVIFIAGLLSIPESLYEAAKIDGATKLQSFTKITVPMLKPTMFFVMVSATIYSLFQVFDIVNVTTGGGPVGSTEMLVTYLYKVGFEQFQIGYASAIAFVLFIMTALITVIQKKFIEER
ncbi:carbohydrate ABC transporter permease [Vallitalea okinawensis]|uniref:carbohydrate ABC transporter permease n=1 Tax=Vallitalea okinawensis TaxID=2078660 RepID=UPI000CFC7743|nr:sugar ABC transporter permease [Vallitalea okinawensis]